MNDNSNPYSNFESNPTAEKNGIWVDYGKFGVLLARAGGSNEAYLRAAERKGRLLRRSGRSDIVALQNMNRELVIETCILGWAVNETKPDGTIEVRKGFIYDSDTKTELEANRQNIRKVLTKFPGLIDSIAQDAQDASLFNISKEEEEEEVGN